MDGQQITLLLFAFSYFSFLLEILPTNGEIYQTTFQGKEIKVLAYQVKTLCFIFLCVLNTLRIIFFPIESLLQYLLIRNKEMGIIHFMALEVN